MNIFVIKIEEITIYEAALYYNAEEKVRENEQREIKVYS